MLVEGSSSSSSKSSQSFHKETGENLNSDELQSISWSQWWGKLVSSGVQQLREVSTGFLDYQAVTDRCQQCIRENCENADRTIRFIELFANQIYPVFQKEIDRDRGVTSHASVELGKWIPAFVHYIFAEEAKRRKESKGSEVTAGEVWASLIKIVLAPLNAVNEERFDAECQAMLKLLVPDTQLTPRFFLFLSGESEINNALTQQLKSIWHEINESIQGLQVLCHKKLDVCLANSCTDLVLAVCDSLGEQMCEAILKKMYEELRINEEEEVLLKEALEKIENSENTTINEELNGKITEEQLEAIYRKLGFSKETTTQNLSEKLKEERSCLDFYRKELPLIASDIAACFCGEGDSAFGQFSKETLRPILERFFFYFFRQFGGERLESGVNDFLARYRARKVQQSCPQSNKLNKKKLNEKKALDPLEQFIKETIKAWTQPQRNSVPPLFKMIPFSSNLKPEWIDWIASSAIKQMDAISEVYKTDQNQEIKASWKCVKQSSLVSPASDYGSSSSVQVTGRVEIINGSDLYGAICCVLKEGMNQLKQAPKLTSLVMSLLHVEESFRSNLEKRIRNLLKQPVVSEFFKIAEGTVRQLLLKVAMAMVEHYQGSNCSEDAITDFFVLNQLTVELQQLQADKSSNVEKKQKIEEKQQAAEAQFAHIVGGRQVFANLLPFNEKYRERGAGLLIPLIIAVIPKVADHLMAKNTLKNEKSPFLLMLRNHCSEYSVIINLKCLLLGSGWEVFVQRVVKAVEDLSLSRMIERVLTEQWFVDRLENMIGAIFGHRAQKLGGQLRRQVTAGELLAAVITPIITAIGHALPNYRKKVAELRRERAQEENIDAMRREVFSQVAEETARTIFQELFPNGDADFAPLVLIKPGLIESIVRAAIKMVVQGAMETIEKNIETHQRQESTLASVVGKYVRAQAMQLCARNRNAMIGQAMEKMFAFMGTDEEKNKSFVKAFAPSLDEALKREENPLWETCGQLIEQFTYRFVDGLDADAFSCWMYLIDDLVGSINNALAEGKEDFEDLEGYFQPLVAKIQDNIVVRELSLQFLIIPSNEQLTRLLYCIAYPLLKSRQQAEVRRAQLEEIWMRGIGQKGKDRQLVEEGESESGDAIAPPPGEGGNIEAFRFIEDVVDGITTSISVEYLGVPKFLADWAVHLLKDHIDDEKMNDKRRQIEKAISRAWGLDEGENRVAVGSQMELRLQHIARFFKQIIVEVVVKALAVNEEGMNGADSSPKEQRGRQLFLQCIEIIASLKNQEERPHHCLKGAKAIMRLLGPERDWGSVDSEDAQPIIVDEKWMEILSGAGDQIGPIDRSFAAFTLGIIKQALLPAVLEQIATLLFPLNPEVPPAIGEQAIEVGDFLAEQFVSMLVIGKNIEGDPVSSTLAQLLVDGVFMPYCSEWKRKDLQDKEARNAAAEEWKRHRNEPWPDYQAKLPSALVKDRNRQALLRILDQLARSEQQENLKTLKALLSAQIQAFFLRVYGDGNIEERVDDLIHQLKKLLGEKKMPDPRCSDAHYDRYLEEPMPYSDAEIGETILVKLNLKNDPFVQLINGLNVTIGIFVRHSHNAWYSYLSNEEVAKWGERYRQARHQAMSLIRQNFFISQEDWHAFALAWSKSAMATTVPQKEESVSEGVGASAEHVPGMVQEWFQESHSSFLRGTGLEIFLATQKALAESIEQLVAALLFRSIVLIAEEAAKDKSSRSFQAKMARYCVELLNSLLPHYFNGSPELQELSQISGFTDLYQELKKLLPVYVRYQQAAIDAFFDSLIPAIISPMMKTASRWVEEELVEALPAGDKGKGKEGNQRAFLLFSPDTNRQLAKTSRKIYEMIVAHVASGSTEYAQTLYDGIAYQHVFPRKEEMVGELSSAIQYVCEYAKVPIKGAIPLINSIFSRMMRAYTMKLVPLVKVNNNDIQSNIEDTKFVSMLVTALLALYNRHNEARKEADDSSEEERSAALTNALKRRQLFHYVLDASEGDPERFYMDVVAKMREWGHVTDGEIGEIIPNQLRSWLIEKLDSMIPSLIRRIIQEYENPEHVVGWLLAAVVDLQERQKSVSQALGPTKDVDVADSPLIHEVEQMLKGIDVKIVGSFGFFANEAKVAHAVGQNMSYQIEGIREKSLDKLLEELLKLGEKRPEQEKQNVLAQTEGELLARSGEYIRDAITDWLLNSVNESLEKKGMQRANRPNFLFRRFLDLTVQATSGSIIKSTVRKTLRGVLEKLLFDNIVYSSLELFVRFFAEPAEAMREMQTLSSGQSIPLLQFSNDKFYEEARRRHLDKATMTNTNGRKVSTEGVTIEQVLRNGHCLFVAMGRQWVEAIENREDRAAIIEALPASAELQQYFSHVNARNDQKLQQLMRLLACNQLKENPSPGIKHYLKGKPLGEYLDKMKNSSMYGGEPEILALAQLLNLKVTIIDANPGANNIWIFEGTQEHSHHCGLILCNRHYDIAKIPPQIVSGVLPYGRNEPKEKVSGGDSRVPHQPV